MALKAGYKGIKEVGPGLKLDPTNGRLELEGESSLELDNLEDVSITEPAGGDILAYSDADDLWFNQTPANAPTQGSSTPISSGGVYNAIKATTYTNFTAAQEKVTVDTTISKATKVLNMVYLRLRFTLSEASGTSEQPLIELPDDIAPDHYPLLTIMNRTAPYASVGNAYISPNTKKIQIEGLNLAAGVYDITFTYSVT